MTALYPILTESLVAPSDFPWAAGEVVAAGAAMVQVRLKTLTDPDVLEVLERVSDHLAIWPGTLVVNDRADLARLLFRRKVARGHHHKVGLHLGQGDLSPREARAIVGPDVVIGHSTHDLAQLERGLGEPVQHLAYGPVFPTANKANPDPVVGLDGAQGLAAAVARARRADMPLVAIGGITADNVRAVVDTGVTGVAVIGAVFSGPREGIGARARAVVEAMWSHP